MMKKALLPAAFFTNALLFFSPAGAQVKPQPAPSFTKYVDPYIGTGFHGHVFLGANVPFGAVQLGPVNITEGWDWCSGYHISDTTIAGFSHTHLSGTGIGDLGDILLMPVTQQVSMRRSRTGMQMEDSYFTVFSRETERVRPGYYSVFLPRFGVHASLTASERVGFHKYVFPPSPESAVIIDLEAGIGWDDPAETYLHQVNDSTIAGYRYSRGWAAFQKIFFTAVFSKPITGIQLYDSIQQKEGTSLKAQRVKAVVGFASDKSETVLVKVGISPVSEENALMNIRMEIPHWNFDAVVQKADAAWNKELGKINIETDNEDRKKTFYTALYHTMIAPSLFNDHNNDYRGTDDKIYRKANFNNLTTFSLWDTYRAANPLYTIFQPERVKDMVASMLAIYRQQGKLPIWHLMGNETNTMPGYSAVSVLADATLKGLAGVPDSVVLNAMIASAMKEERGIQYVKKYGFIPADSMHESVAMAMEYSIADAGIALLAKKMGRTEAFKYWQSRSENYRRYYDESTRFMRGKITDAEWRTPFSPFESKHNKDDFCEGNAWQYTWLAPQDVPGLITLLGGEERFVKKLDSLFTVSGDMGAEASSDISGLIGQYAHGNEPSHHITYLYMYAGQPWKTADKVRHILDSMYTAKPDGICGNEDVGQMSAWYIFSALGFYPVHPSKGTYVFGSPVVNRAELKLQGGKVFRLIVRNNSAENKYIQRITWNGVPYAKSFFRHSELVKGGTMVVEMGAKPSPTWGVAKSFRP